ncbi:MAG: DUF374 domain-containing protein [Pseudomonadota bacterium]
MTHSNPSDERARKTLKSARSSAFLRWVIGVVGAGFLYLQFYTTRWRWVGRHHLDAMFASGGFLASVWHSRLIPIAMLRPRGRRALALVSNNRDGDLIARVVANTGGEVVRGSSRDPKKADKEKKGSEALRTMVQAVAEEVIVVVTPDGPRGPRQRIKPGVVLAAAAAGCPVLPVAYSVRWGFTLKSWDRFLVPLPFNSGVFVFEAPIPPADPDDPASIQERIEQLEAAMARATAEADRITGRSTPEPGPPIETVLSEAQA